MQKRLMWLENNGYTNENVVTHTKTTRFLMPLIGISEFSLEHINPKLLINAHCASTDDKLIYIILNKFHFPEEAESYLELQNLNEHFIDYIDEEQEYILIYKIPQHFEDDYIKILKGDYSLTSEHYKQVMIRVYGIAQHKDNHQATVYDVLFPTEFKRKQLAERVEHDITEIIEVCSKPDMDYEIFKPIEKLIENYGTQETS